MANFDIASWMEEHKKELEQMAKKRTECLKQQKTDYEITFSGFIPADSGLLPQEYEQCIIISNKGTIQVGIWDESMQGKSHAPEGSFFDGGMGHFTLQNIVAWKPLDQTNTLVKKVAK